MMDHTFKCISSESKTKFDGRVEPSRGIIAPDGRWISYPEEAGEIVLWEDRSTYLRRRNHATRYIRLIQCLGAVFMVMAISLFGFLEESMTQRSVDRLYLLGIGGFLIFLFSSCSDSMINDTRQTAFFTGGFGMLIPQIGCWQLWFVPWDDVHTFRHLDHPHHGPVIQLGFSGGRILVLGTMEGFDRIDRLIGDNVSTRPFQEMTSL